MFKRKNWGFSGMWRTKAGLFSPNVYIDTPFVRVDYGRLNGKWNLRKRSGTRFREDV